MPIAHARLAALLVLIGITITAAAGAQTSQTTPAEPEPQKSAAPPTSQINSTPPASPAPPAPPQNPAQPNSKAAAAPQNPATEEHQRVAFVVPNFGTTNIQNAPALTPKEKFVLFAKGAFDPFAFGVAGLQAGISEWEDEFCGSQPPGSTVHRNCPDEYGQGVLGFAKRYGASFADATDSGFQSNFLWPVILKEDPRYFRVGSGRVKHRMWHAVYSEVWCKTDKATWTVCLENIFGAFSTGAISNIYYPPEERGVGLTISRSSISLAYGVVGDLGSEFWPDIHHWLFHRHQPQQATMPP